MCSVQQCITHDMQQYYMYESKQWLPHTVFFPAWLKVWVWGKSHLYQSGFCLKSSSSYPPLSLSPSLSLSLSLISESEDSMTNRCQSSHDRKSQGCYRRSISKEVKPLSCTHQCLNGIVLIVEVINKVIQDKSKACDVSNRKEFLSSTHTHTHKVLHGVLFQLTRHIQGHLFREDVCASQCKGIAL